NMPVMLKVRFGESSDVSDRAMSGPRDGPFERPQQTDCSRCWRRSELALPTESGLSAALTLHDSASPTTRGNLALRNSAEADSQFRRRQPAWKQGFAQSDHDRFSQDLELRVRRNPPLHPRRHGWLELRETIQSADLLSPRGSSHGSWHGRISQARRALHLG